MKSYEKNNHWLASRIIANQIENKISFGTKSKIFLKFLTSETMKLLENNKKKIKKDEYGENVVRWR